MKQMSAEGCDCPVEEGTSAKTVKRPDPPLSIHPDHSANINRIKRMKGQMDGVEKMIVARRYCVDIVTQIRAVRQALRALEGTILEKHLHHCVHDAITLGSKSETNKKIEEIIGLLKFNS